MAFQEMRRTEWSLRIWYVILYLYKTSPQVPKLSSTYYFKDLVVPQISTAHQILSFDKMRLVVLI